MQFVALYNIIYKGTLSVRQERFLHMEKIVIDGKIVEQGNHASLMKQKGHYYNLYTRQYEEDATKNILS